jgi:starvation-inducible outer membrane lipoprotein
MRSLYCLCVCVSVYPPIVARQRLDKISLIVARQRLDKISLIVARQRLGGNVTAVTNTHAIIEE